MRSDRMMLRLALLAALLGALPRLAGADGLPSVQSVAGEAMTRSGGPPDRDAREALLSAVLSRLWDIKLIPAVRLDCGGLPICPPDMIYYEQASVDANVASAVSDLPELIRSGRRDAAVERVDSIRRSTSFNALAPRQVALYPRYLVDEKLDAAVALLSAPAKG